MQELIDAYAHVGSPRYCPAPTAWDFLRARGVGRAVFVLGPQVPDYVSLQWLMIEHPDAVRGIGIPFGRDRVQEEQIIQMQIDAGVLGLRVGPNDIVARPWMMELLGRQGGAVYVVDPCKNLEVATLLLDWLDSYTKSKVVACHFLRHEPFDVRVPDFATYRRLMAHPRFFAILSRQGGRSLTPDFPYTDLRPWVEQVLEFVGWDRVLWGSEFPAFLWRNETMDQCKKWLVALLGEISAAELEKFQSSNAFRAFFSEHSIKDGHFDVPGWVNEQFDRSRKVPVFPMNSLDLPAGTYFQAVSEYLRLVGDSDEPRFAEFISDLVGKGIARDA